MRLKKLWKTLKMSTNEIHYLHGVAWSIDEEGNYSIEVEGKKFKGRGGADRLAKRAFKIKELIVERDVRDEKGV